jgi:hypothetical protein
LRSSASTVSRKFLSSGPDVLQQAAKVGHVHDELVVFVGSRIATATPTHCCRPTRLDDDVERRSAVPLPTPCFSR